ncbi:hypothetical protein VTI74DRAFT_1096 [Chaetomium olivicolor]
MFNPLIDFRLKVWAYPPDQRRGGLLVEPKQYWGLSGFLVAAVVPSQDQTTITPEPVDISLPPVYEAYKDLFTSSDRPPLPRHTALEHRIDLDPAARPPWGPIYPLSAVELETLRAWLAEALQKGWIRPSTSPAGAPILFVPKKQGELRLVVDYRALNHITLKNRAPLPLIGEILDRLSSAKIYTKLDLKDAYYRIRIREGDEWKTAFRTRYGHYEFLVMPMGLANAPATFQTYINHAMGGLVDVICIVYLDDILIFSDDEAQHTQHVLQVLERLREADLYVNLQKCQFHTTQVSFLGYLVSPGGIAMEPDRVAAIATWPLPGSVKDIQVFLGFTGFYRRFIRNYSKVCTPLTDLLRGDQTRPFHLTESARDAFDQLRRYFQEAPILRHFDPSLPIRVETDASKRAVGAVLSQLADGHWRPVAFRSRKLTPEETRYHTGEGELLALIDAFRTWRQYLLYSQFPILCLTDHLNLESLRTKKRPSARQLRWSDELASFDFIVKYRPGSQNPADGLSRRPDYQDPASTTDAENPLFTLLAERVARGEDFSPEDTTRPGVVALIRQGTKPPILQARELRLRAAEDAAELRREMSPCAELPLGQEDEVSRETGRGDKRGRDPASQCVEEALTKRIRWGDSVFDATRRQFDLRAHEEDVPRPGIPPCEQDAPDHRILLVGAIGTGSGIQGTKAKRDDPLLEDLLQEAQADDPFVRDGAWKTQHSRGDRKWFIGKDGLLRHYSTRIYVPKNLRQELLSRLHDAPTAGHGGIRKTRTLVGRNYYWDTLKEDVEQYVKHCVVCQRTKARNHRPYGELAPLPVPDSPWQDITVDFITGLPSSIDPRSNRPCNAVLVFVDKLTKYALYIATSTKLSASAFAELFFQHVFRPFGLPASITSDRGSLFTSNFWDALCDLLAVKRRLSTAFHPQTDGQTERQNQILEQYLRAFCSYDQADWAHHLILAEYTYNTSYHTATQTTPAYLLYGFHPRGPDEALPLRPSIAPAANERIAAMEKCRKVAQDLLVRANETYAKWYDKKRTPMAFKPKDWVLLSTKYLRQKRPSKKLADKYLGPFQILEAVGDRKMAYRLDLPPRYRIHNTFPISLLEPFKGSPQEAQALYERVEVEPEEQHYEVEAILDHAGPPNNRHYLIKWKGYAEDDNTWEPRIHIDDGPMIQAYEERLRQRKRGTRT